MCRWLRILELCRIFDSCAAGQEYWSYVEYLTHVPLVKNSFRQSEAAGWERILASCADCAEFLLARRGGAGAGQRLEFRVQGKGFGI